MFLFRSNEILHILDDTVGIDGGLGSPDWRLVVCLLIAWISIGFTLIKGVQSSGKVRFI